MTINSLSFNKDCDLKFLDAFLVLTFFWASIQPRTALTWWHGAAGDILAIPDISVEESEDLPRIIEPIVSDAARQVAECKQVSTDVSLEQVAAAIRSASPQLQKLEVC